MTATEDLYGWLASHDGAWTGTVFMTAPRQEGKTAFMAQRAVARERAPLTDREVTSSEG